jgi:NADH-quinone oxidoreductase subunit J
MSGLLIGAAAVAVASTVAVVVQRRAVHALLYLIVSFFALAVAMLALGAAFAAALEVVVYAGAILVLFVFVVMMLGTEGTAPKAMDPGLRGWIGPSILSLILLGELAWALASGRGMISPPGAAGAAVSPKAVGIALFGPYALCVEIAAFLLLSGLVGAYHLGRPIARDGGGGA